jgi:hypothetical protein
MSQIFNDNQIMFSCDAANLLNLGRISIGMDNIYSTRVCSYRLFDQLRINIKSVLFCINGNGDGIGCLDSVLYYGAGKSRYNNLSRFFPAAGFDEKEKSISGKSCYHKMFKRHKLPQ